MGQLSELPPDTRSYSQLSQYTKCAEEYRLKRIERRAEAPAVWFPAGTAFHEITELFDRWALNDGLTAAAAKDWGSRFSETFEAHLDELREQAPDESKWRVAGVSKALPNGEDIAWWAERGP